MKNKLTRKKFMATVAGAGSLFFLNKMAKANTNQDSGGSVEQSTHPYFPSQNPELVQEMVLVAHGQVDKVKELLVGHPELSKAAWDWGFGDWETALGAASHTGNKEIAELLMANGARPDLFTFTMLGNLAAVKAMIEGNPGVQKISGPHGISLLSHAKIRLVSKSIVDSDKPKMQAMIDYLTALGDADPKAVSLEISDNEKKQFIGKFAFGEKPNEVFTVELSDKGMLQIKNPGMKFERPLFRVEENSFAPMGAPHVKITFEVKDAVAMSMTLNDPVTMVKAIRQ